MDPGEGGCQPSPIQSGCLMAWWAFVSPDANRDRIRGAGSNTVAPSVLKWFRYTTRRRQDNSSTEASHYEDISCHQPVRLRHFPIDALAGVDPALEGERPRWGRDVAVPSRRLWEPGAFQRFIRRKNDCHEVGILTNFPLT